MSQDYQITAVTGAKEWSGKHGRFIDYYVDLAEYGENCVLTQKDSTDTPEPGDTVYGHIEIKNATKRDGTPFTVYKLKRDQRPDPSHGPTDSGPQTAASGNPRGRATAGSSPPSSADNGDARSRRIERQAAWKVAAALTGPQPSREAFEGWLDYLSEDLDAYEKSRGIKPELPTVDEELAGKEPAFSGAGVDDGSDLPF